MGRASPASDTKRTSAASMKANAIGSILLLLIFVLTLVFALDVSSANYIAAASLLLLDLTFIALFTKGVYPHMYMPGSAPMHRFSGRYILYKKT